MPIPRYRLFFDTGAYIAGLLSPSGAARELLRLAEARAVAMVVSEEVVTEADRVIAVKFPELVQESRILWKGLEPEVVANPTPHQMEKFRQKLRPGDAAILCAAQLAKVSAFVTWNTRDFMSPGITLLVDFPIVVPADALGLFRKWIDPYLD